MSQCHAMMKEIIYIHAATSYQATHFFNTQQSYFNYDEAEDEEIVVDSDISFREGLAADGSATYCPRLLLFDYKSKFGSLSHISTALGSDTSTSVDPTWTGPVTEFRQAPIPRSTYHEQIDAGENEDHINPSNFIHKDGTEHVQDLTSSVRFWSDFSRVFYHPRGLHRVPDVSDWERDVEWSRGKERFENYDADHAVVEDSFRLFAEECDLLQGVQLSLDAPSFGSFTAALLTQLKDDYPKISFLSFCSLSRYSPAQVNLEDTSACIGALNDALSLQELASLSSITIPLQHPVTWQRGTWSEHVTADFTNVYHSSAILSASIESATLPLRLKSPIPSSTDLATFCAQLNWRGDTPFAALFSAFPMPSSFVGHDKRIFDFSHSASVHYTAIPFAQRDIFRGLSFREKDASLRWVEETHPGLREPLRQTSFLDLPYPIPSSYPQIFDRLDVSGQCSETPPPVGVRSLPTYSSMRTTSQTGILAESYAQLLKGIRKRNRGILADLGAETEAVTETEEAFWGWIDAYGGIENTEEKIGEDE